NTKTGQLSHVPSSVSRFASYQTPRIIMLRQPVGIEVRVFHSPFQIVNNIMYGLGNIRPDLCIYSSMFGRGLSSGAPALPTRPLPARELPSPPTLRSPRLPAAVGLSARPLPSLAPLFCTFRN